MKKEIIFLKPVFKELIWGGNRLKTFGYEIPSDFTGECWAISAHPNGDCIVNGGVYNGIRLSELWNNHRELFGNKEGDKFPLLIKIIDAKDDLSIQVHPDDEYANINENGSLGKTECWYILDCDENATIVIGHNAKNKKELRDMIQNHRWNEFIREIPIHKGDFFQIEPGCLHAIKGGTLILETQQNSDITYRVYDYDRLQDGKSRELHIKQSIDVIKVPFIQNSNDRKFYYGREFEHETLIKCEYYSVEKLTVKGTVEYEQAHNFMNVSVIDGKGTIDNYPIKKGDNFIIPARYGTAKIIGQITMIISYIE